MAILAEKCRKKNILLTVLTSRGSEMVSVLLLTLQIQDGRNIVLIMLSDLLKKRLCKGFDSS